jgi:tetratricopeptide (TPR) repeat protein
MRLLLCLLMLLISPVALAIDKIIYGPPAAWVKATEAPTSAPNSVAGAPIAVLLYDQQYRFEADRSETYVKSVVALQTPQGLAQFGTISQVWKADTDDLIVHELRILRGDKVIDVLKDNGQTFLVLRREQGLEYSILNGLLTATLQIEGLEVGDKVVSALTIVSREPVLKGRWQEIGAAPFALAMEKWHVRASWTSDQSMRWRVGRGMDASKFVKDPDGRGLTLTMIPAPRLQPPESAPGRYYQLRQIEFSAFSNWAEISSLFDPLYIEAAKLKADSPIKAEIEKIRQANKTPEQQAAAALTVVQKRIRYVYLGMNNGGLVPANADDTWNRRFGDCKGKTALLLALLKGLGIEAQPAVVSSTLGNGLNERLPLVGAFDHILVRAKINGKVYWLDGTRTHDVSLALLPSLPFEWALPIQPANATLIAMPIARLDTPNEEATYTIDLSKGIDKAAQVSVEVQLNGDEGRAIADLYASLDPAQLDTSMRDFWKRQYKLDTIDSVGGKFDESKGAYILFQKGQKKITWDKDTKNQNSSWNLNTLALGWTAEFKRSKDADHLAPFLVAHPNFKRVNMTIQLPDKGMRFQLKPVNIKETLAGIEYFRTSTLKGGVLTAVTTSRSLASEVPAAGIDKDAKRLTDIYNDDPVLTAISGKNDIIMNDSFKIEFDDAIKLLRAQKAKEAITAFDHLAQKAPDNAWIYANRAIAHGMDNNLAAAKADIEKSLAIQSDNSVAFEAKSMLAMAENKYDDALAALNRAIELDPSRPFLRKMRADVMITMNDYQSAVPEIESLLKEQPTELDYYLKLASSYKRLGNKEKALSTVQAAISANPKSEMAYTIAAATYAAYGDRLEALKLYDKSIAIKPTASAYYSRSHYRDNKDVAGKLDDLNKSIELEPDQTTALSDRASLWLKMGKTANARADFALARKSLAAETNGLPLNNLCWAQAVAGFDLEVALADCDAALKLSPQIPAIPDSRAFVLLRLGRNEEAAGEYTHALALYTKSAASLYGRSLAYARMGKAKDAATDRAAALALAPYIVEEFKGYGLVK